MNLINWVKQNKLTTVLLVIVAYFLFNSITSTFLGVSTLSLDRSSQSTFGTTESLAPMAGSSLGSAGRPSLPIIPPDRDFAPQPDVENRLVIQESNLSLLVADVVQTRNQILEHTKGVGGYMVNANTSNPQDAPTSTIVIRVPEDKLQSSLDYFRGLSIKVVSENLVGRDVTDQYVDIEERLQTLEATKARFESILEQATEIQDITSLTQQILNYQSQIDNLRGQQQSLEQNARLAKLTIYLSTDEIALPYAPSETFRPNVIFKLAVRSLVGTLRNFAEIAIWLGVYSVIWVPALIILWVIRRWMNRRKIENR